MKKILCNFFTIFCILFSIENTLSAQKIGGGAYHSLFLCGYNAASASGLGGWGQLGNGTNSPKDSIPVQVSLTGGITAVSAGGNHSLFLKNDSTVWASGANFYGQLGDGAHPSLDKYTPIRINWLTRVKAVSAGGCHSLFLKNDSTVWACGHNLAGQLGGYPSSPYNQVSALTGIIAVSAGRHHSLFLKHDGTVWTCGENAYGQLGDGTTTPKNIPVQVAGLTGITAIAGGGSHSLFLRNDGTVWGCGANLNGELGDGTTTQRNIPTQVIGLTGVIIAISAGKDHSLFLRDGGTVWSCGSNSNGQLGDGTYKPRTTPFQVSSLRRITEISAGWLHSLFLEEDGTVWACGKNTYGALGDGTTLERNTPVRTKPLCIMTGIEKIPETTALLIYPNPTSGELTVESSETISSITITNLIGEKIYSSNCKAEKTEIDLGSQPKGIYFIDMLSGSERRTRKLILE